ncbi:uncharacterized protein LOC101208580 [Cucumis sativus]|uniref:Large ribosomal subunit protein bL25 beta domain-containing protein n=1 Tax=Cucumis sativus TaxID=3659 RepID=A0A0A0LJM8_CUCSA|nr:uncharacterized protein LOC101208580 [Cucumis sativus]KGN62070.1 hypothetical protein Csa_006311 [Cucumis sativus]
MANWWRSARTNLRLAAFSGTKSESFPFSSFRAAYHTIQAIPRECSGRKISSKDRAQGRIPAVVFSQQILEKNSVHGSPSRKHLLTTERKQIHSILKSVELPFFCSTRFKLQIRAGSGSSVLLESGSILPIKIHRNEETGKIFNIVFVWADEGSELKVDVPIVFKGEEACPGLQKGGQLNKIRTSLKYLCPAEHIPSKIEVDVSNLDIGDRIFIRDVDVHSSMKLLSKNEVMPICKIVTIKSETANTETSATSETSETS